MALSKGVQDAIAGAGSYAITNYIDLGAGILILAYGGNLNGPKSRSFWSIDSSSVQPHSLTKP
jgi:hypothetical protein